MRRPYTLVLALVLALASGPARPAAQDFTTASLTIDTAKGVERFTVELALDPAQQEQGLMFRRALAPDAGMLFIFHADHEAVFWMKNTLIPLDMLFIAADGRIADLHERAVPLSESYISAKVPVRAVLEVNGGTVARLGIKIGDLVHYPAFGTQR
jgi:uncharacterized protein